MENPVIILFLLLGVIVAAARVGAATARRLNQPRVLGELLVGVILGPTLLDLMHMSLFGINEAHMQATIMEMAELGVLMLMFKVGLEVHISELFKVGGVAVFAGTVGALLPVALTIPVAMAFDHTWQAGLFAGVTLAATSVSISAQVLLELGVLRTKEGSALLAAALVDDVMAILLISITIAIIGPGGEVNAGDMLRIIVEMTAYIIIAGALSWFGLPRLFEWLKRRYELSEAYGIAALGLVTALLFGWSAEQFGGIAPITGAFIAGVGFSRMHGSIKNEIDEAVSNIAYAFLVPIFFVSVGLQVDLSIFPMNAVALAVMLMLVSVFTKVAGCWAGARAGGFSNLEAFRLGVCMISRGEVGLIIAALGLTTRTFTADDPLFASLFLVILVTTVVTPPLVRRVFEMGSDEKLVGQTTEGESHGETHPAGHTTS